MGHLLVSVPHFYYTLSHQELLKNYYWSTLGDNAVCIGNYDRSMTGKSHCLTDFPMMNNNSTCMEHFSNGFSYWIYGVMANLSGLSLWKHVSGTKGRTNEEMGNLWLRKN